MQKRNNKIKIGILGGSFNPPHKGHLFISEFVFKKFGLKKIIWLVSPQNPLKNNYKNLEENFLQRFANCKNFTAKNNYIEVSDAEYKFFRHNKKFFTIDFLKRFSKLNKNFEIKFIIGADNLINFHSWKNYKEISKFCEIIAVNRVDNNFNLKYKAQKSKFGISGKYKFVNCKTIDISSTKIRNKNFS
ncbi:MAG: nicotinate (nicotinamide) nucleotide adenylyltransferase [Rickettsiales bacterium]|nr:nicotinate (nicotinamide) nucleotide adenylyltransferase [Rickettsiales bacterium]